MSVFGRVLDGLSGLAGIFINYIYAGGCVKTLAQPHLYFKFCYIFFWLCYFFLMHLATSCYIPIISGYK